MRADRLLSLLMLLQTRGRVTARDLSGELEVSERTIYRDIEALSMAGVPVYAERGPGGGCALLDSYRTSLTGLNEDEVRALFMLSVPAPLTDLGVSQELKAAMLKLSASLPTARRIDEERSRKRIHLDSVWWHQPEEKAPHLQTIHRALWDNRKLRLVYHLPFNTLVERIVEPYGLVAKTSVWYLVCARDDHIRVQRVANVVEADILDESFEFPPGFDLTSFWQEWCVDYENNRPLYPVTVRVSPQVIPYLSWYFKNEVREVLQVAPPDDEEWVTLTLPFESFESARMHIMSYGRAIEVIEPEALRKSVIDFAEQIIGFYGTKSKHS